MLRRIRAPLDLLDQTAGRQKPPPGTPINWDDPVAQGLRFYTDFGGAPKLFGASAAKVQGARDLVQRVYLDTPNPSATTPTVGAPSRTGSTITFPGGASSFFVKFPDRVGFENISTGGLTVAAKLRLRTSSANRAIIAKGPIVASSHHYILSTNPAAGDGNLTFEVRDATAVRRATTVSSYSDGAAYTVFGMWDGATVFIAVFSEDGILLELVAGDATAGPLANTTQTLRIGGFNNDPGGNTFVGDLEWIGIWARALQRGDMQVLASKPYRHFRTTALPGWITPPIAVTNTNITPPAGAVVISGIAPIVQETIVPSGIASGEAFGVHALVDAATTIAPSGIASAEGVGSHELIDAVGAAGTVSPSGIVSAEAFGTASVTETATISPTGIASAFDMDLHNVGVAVGTIAPSGIASEEAFSQVAAGGGINGGTTVVTPTNPPATAGTVTAKKLCAPLGLLRAEVIDTALDQAVVLPDVYGDFSTGGLRGPCPAVLVNSTSPFIYIAAAHPVKEITNVYVDDVEQTSGFATVTAVDLGAGFQVAVIAFSTQPTGQVSWRGKGRMDDSLALIENPIEQLETILKHRNSWTTEDFDATTLAEAKAAATAAGWTTAFVFADDRQVQDWITEVLFNVMGFWRVSGRAQLQVTLDPGGSTFPQSDLVDSIVASRDCIDGDDGVTFVADRQHLVNKLEAYYLYSWSLGQPASRLVDLDDELSQNAHGELRKSVTLRGLRSSALVTAWADILFERQGFGHRVEGATVQFRVKGSRLVHTTVGDLIAFTWPYGPTRESSNQYVNEILRVLTISHDLSEGGNVAITAIDTGAYVQSGGTRLLTPLAL